MFLQQIQILLPFYFEGGGWCCYSKNQATQVQLSLAQHTGTYYTIIRNFQLQLRGSISHFVCPSLCQSVLLTKFAVNLLLDHRIFVLLTSSLTKTHRRSDPDQFYWIKLMTFPNFHPQAAEVHKFICSTAHTLGRFPWN